MNKKQFGTLPDGRAVYAYTLSCHCGISAEIIEFGGALRRLCVPDKDGRMRDLVLGYDHLDAYLINPPFFGVLVGRVANRISGAEFTLNGKTYELPKNDAPNHLHGGPGGLHHRLWQTVEYDASSLTLEYISPDGEEGYPGTLSVRVKYALGDDGTLSIEYTAEGSEDTPVSLTNHSYFNLNGHDGGDVLSHLLEIQASAFVPCDEARIPRGALRALHGTPYDFNASRAIGSRINEPYDQLILGQGYNQCYALSGEKIGEHNGRGIRKVSELYSYDSGIRMSVVTTEPGMHLYCANTLDGSLVGKNGARYSKNAGACFETGGFPDAVNRPDFPPIILKKGDTYRQFTAFGFSR